MSNVNWEAASLIPVRIEVRPLTPSTMHVYLVMQCRCLEQPDGDWPNPRLVTDGDR
jgi:hypothetical protein